jgi:sortase A
MPRTAERLARRSAAVLLALGAIVLGQQAWLSAKATVAARLIDRAFAAHLSDGAPHAPWGWADTHPVARLEIPRLGLRRTVLAGASGSSLAFGPGHIDGTAAPNTPGNCAIAGHRDSWFAFLARLQLGDQILLRSHDVERGYIVAELLVVDEHDLRVVEPTAERRLTLITCYPFGDVRRSPLRYVVIGVPATTGSAREPLRS